MTLKEIEKQWPYIINLSDSVDELIDVIALANRDIQWLISRVKELEGAIDRHRCSLNADHDKDYVGCRADKELYAHLAKPLADNDK